MVAATRTTIPTQPRTLPNNRIPGAERVLGGAQAQIRDDVRAILDQAAQRIGMILVRYAGVDGVIPQNRRRDVQRETGDVLSRVFVGADGRNAFGPDGVTPLSPYALALNLALARVQAGAVRIQGEWIAKHAPADVLQWLRSGQPRQPIVAETTRTDELKRLYRDLLVDTGHLGYDPAHTFVGEDGYTLSDRIWRTGNATRAKVDQFIADGIQQGIGAFDLAKRLEQFLTPGRADLKTNRPYGKDASADAMRLARTEITAAFGRATMAASRTNPYVTQMWWKLSASHPKADICDAYEDGSPYVLDRVPNYPAHPYCLCVLVPLVEQVPDKVSRELQALMVDAQSNLRPYLNPAQIEDFTRYLIGDVMNRLLGQRGQMDILQFAQIIVPF